jgi:hypothetical protein
MGSGSPFPGGKARPRRDVDHSPHLVPWSWMSRSCTSSPPQAPPRHVVKLLCFYFFNRLHIRQHIYNITLPMYTTSIKIFSIYHLSWGSSVSIVSDYTLHNRAARVRSPAKAKDLFSGPVSRPALWPTWPPIQGVPGVLPPRVKAWLGCDVSRVAHPALTFAWSNWKEDCIIDRGITLDLVVYPAVSCPNLIDRGELYSW